MGVSVRVRLLKPELALEVRVGVKVMNLWLGFTVRVIGNESVPKIIIKFIINVGTLSFQ